MTGELLRVFCGIDEISEAFSEDIPGTTDFDAFCILSLSQGFV
jgi:hypothetical protein